MEKLRKYATALLVITPIILFFLLFFKYTVNAPLNDDYVLLTFINECITTQGTWDKIKLFFAQHNEHRIVYDRLWTVISYKLNKNVNFNFLALLGNLSLLGIAYVFYKKFTVSKKDLLLFFPVTVLIFNITSWENITFAMATLSNFTVVLFVLLSLKYLTEETKDNYRNLVLAFVFFILAVLTQGGGLFVFPIALLILAYKKEYKNLLIYFIASLVVVLGYFYGFQNYGEKKGIVETIMTYKFSIVQFVFAFLGNAFNYFRIYTTNMEESTTVTSIIGLLFFIIFLYITYTQYYKKNPFIYSVMLFVLLSSVVTATSRVSFGVEAAASSRYRINGIIFAVALYFWIVETFPVQKKKLLYPILISSLFYFYCLNFKQYEYLHIREKQTNLGILAFNSGDINLLNGDKQNLNFYKDAINRSKELNTYNFPTNEELSVQYPFSKEVESNVKSSNTSRNLLFSVDIIQKLQEDYYIDGWAFIEGRGVKSQKVYVGIKNKEDYFPRYFSTKQIQRFDLNPYFKKGNLENGGYFARIENEFVKSGENEIYLMVLNGEEVIIKKTDKKIIR